jgi:branched-chain amino acid transport system permease protein
MITLAFAQMIYYFRHFLAGLWRRGWPCDLCPQHAFRGSDPFDNAHMFLIAVGVLVIALAVSWMVTNARFGLALQAARQNPGRVSAVGIRPFGVRLVAFVLSAMITGWAGRFMRT